MCYVILALRGGPQSCVRAQSAGRELSRLCMSSGGTRNMSSTTNDIHNSNTNNDNNNTHHHHHHHHQHNDNDDNDIIDNDNNDIGKGQMGSALMGSLRIVCVFDRGTCWVPICQNLTNNLTVLRTIILNLSKFITVAATLLVLTPVVRNQTYNTI